MMHGIDVFVLELAIRELIPQLDCQGSNLGTYGKACSNHASVSNTKQELHCSIWCPMMLEMRI